MQFFIIERKIVILIERKIVILIERKIVKSHKIPIALSVT